MDTQSPYKISLKTLEDLNIDRIFDENPGTEIVIVQIDGTDDSIVAVKKAFLKKFEEAFQKGKIITLAGEILNDVWGYSRLVPTVKNTMYASIIGEHLKESLHYHNTQDYRIRPSSAKVSSLLGEAKNAKNYLQRQTVTVHTL